MVLIINRIHWDKHAGVEGTQVKFHDIVCIISFDIIRTL